MTRHLYANLPRFLTIVGIGLTVSLLTLILAVTFELEFLLPLLLLWLVMLAYYTFVSIWSAYLAFDLSDRRISQLIVSEGQLRPTDQIVYLYVSENRFVE